jgi:hypothetical protein
LNDVEILSESQIDKMRQQGILEPRPPRLELRFVPGGAMRNTVFAQKLGGHVDVGRAVVRAYGARRHEAGAEHQEQRTKRLHGTSLVELL